jgi:hypothetical protein
MPFIRGRYHINPIMGEALEAARDAEAVLLALKQGARKNGDIAGGLTDEDSDGNASAAAPKGPVHRVEIEAAELVSSHSGRAQRGYAMRVHRMPAPDADTQADADSNAAYGSASRYGSRNTAPAMPTQSDTHIFANHDDMLDFLRDELAEDSANR